MPKRLHLILDTLKSPPTGSSWERQERSDYTVKSMRKEIAALLGAKTMTEQDAIIDAKAMLDPACRFISDPAWAGQMAATIRDLEDINTEQTKAFAQQCRDFARLHNRLESVEQYLRMYRAKV